MVNLSALTRTDAEKLVSAAADRVCGRLLMDATGRPTFRSPLDFGPLRRLVQISALGTAALSAAVAQAASESCEINVRVSDISKTAIEGAKVVVREPSSTVELVVGYASSNGTWTTQLKPGSYLFSAESPGYYIAQQPSLLKCDGKTQEVDLVLQVPNMGELVVVDPNVKPLSWSYRLFHTRLWL